MQIAPLLSLLVGVLFSPACAKKTTLTNAYTSNHEIIASQTITPSSRVLDSLFDQPWQWLYGKYAVSYSDGDRKLSVKLSLKCTKDSAANALISFASIPFINSFITKDSILYLNKQDRCYNRLPLESLKELLGVELSLSNLQELFLGMPVSYSASSLKESPNQQLDTLIFVQQDSALTVFYTYVMSMSKIVQQHMVLADGRNMTVSYLAWNEGAIDVPSSILITITDRGKESLLKLVIDKYELNLPHQILVEIPEDYENCP
ncbi:MAG: DUF4292 domain-containing protein [Bacteroidetes bacterium]|nr:DUF4292 domain-containing protein [Bacteroidota bacterium]